MERINEIKEGDRVEAIGVEDGNDLRGEKGTAIKRSPVSGRWFIEFDNYICGNDRMSSFEKIMCKDGHGWNVSPEKLKKIDERQENTEKYGDKDKDEIAWSYSRDKKRGDTACGLLVRKYINRYCGDGEKSENPKDLDKAIDVIQRMKEKSKK